MNASAARTHFVPIKSGLCTNTFACTYTARVALTHDVQLGHTVFDAAAVPGHTCVSAGVVCGDICDQQGAIGHLLEPGGQTGQKHVTHESWNHQQGGPQLKKGPSHLPPVLTGVQRLVFHHPVDVRLGVAGGLTVQDGCVTLVHRQILWLHLKANVYCMCTNTRENAH